MTVALTTGLTRLVFTGPGAYNFQFQVNDPETDLVVTHINATTFIETILTYGVAEDPGYTVTLDQSYNGVVTVVDTGGTLGTTGFINIQRNTPLTQLIDWLNAGPMNMDTLEACFDKLTMICQEFKDTLDSFTLSFLHKGAWAASTVYAIGDVVLYSGSYYVCMIAHTSAGSFNTDYWVEVLDANHTHDIDADDVTYDNSTSGLVANKVRGAIDEVAALVTGQPERYRGLFDASGGIVPAWADLTRGDYGYISVYGIIGGVTFNVGDRIIYNGSTWDRILAIPGVGKNLLRNAIFQVDCMGWTTGDEHNTTAAIRVGWYMPIITTLYNAPDRLTCGAIFAADGDYWYAKVAANSGSYYRGCFCQMLDSSLASLEGLYCTVSADIYSGSLAVYVIPKTIGTGYTIVSLTAISTYLIGTLTSSTPYATGAFPTAPGTEDGYLVLFVDMKTNYTNESYSCRFRHLQVEARDTVSNFIIPSLIDDYVKAGSYAESSLTMGSWDSTNFATQAASASYTGSVNGKLCAAVGNAADSGLNVRFATPKVGVALTGPIFKTPAGASGILVAGNARSAATNYPSNSGTHIKNISGVTWADQSSIYFHWYVIYDLL